MAIKTLDYQFHVEVIRSGQPHPYADSVYEYEITSDSGEFTVKQFCTNVLKPKKQHYKDWNRDDINSYFAGYYTFNKIGDNKYKYLVLEPFCD